MSQKRYNVGTQLLWSANRKSYVICRIMTVWRDILMSFHRLETCPAPRMNWVQRPSQVDSVYSISPSLPQPQTGTRIFND